jgi:hypothetical protein
MLKSKKGKQMLETIFEVAAVAAFFVWMSGYAYVVMHMGEIRDLMKKSEQATKYKVSF